MGTKLVTIALGALAFIAGCGATPGPDWKPYEYRSERERAIVERLAAPPTKTAKPTRTPKPTKTAKPTRTAKPPTPTKTARPPKPTATPKVPCDDARALWQVVQTEYPEVFREIEAKYPALLP